MVSAEKVNIVAKLQTDILRLQGFSWATNTSIGSGLDFINEAFPNGKFPIGCIHEFLSYKREDTAATSGFISGLVASWLNIKGAIIWVSTKRTIFPPALKLFGVQPERFIFIDLHKEKDILWAMEEALKCSAVTAVVAQVLNIDFTASRRLQLAAKENHVTGFLFNRSRNINPTACVSRWRISPQPSSPIIDNSGLEGLPGIGFPKWKIELLRMRNGKPGTWTVQFINGKFIPFPLEKKETTIHTYKEHSGFYEQHIDKKQVG